MSVLDRRYAAYCETLETRGRRRRLPLPRPPGSLVADFSHNDYLGLSRSPVLRRAADRAVGRYGAGATGSRVLSGTHPPHLVLERLIARSLGAEAALVFGGGYLANATALAALLDRGALGAEPQVFVDRLVHASLHHGCALARVREIRFRHGDLVDLRARLRERDPHRPAFVVAETLYGMDGDRTDVPALVALAREFEAFLYLDDAHAIGALGRAGYGLATAEAIRGGLVMGTFGKALGSGGAYVACGRAVRDYLVQRCGGIVYTTAVAPATAAAAYAAWRLLPGLDAARARLAAHGERLRAGLRAAGYATGGADAHVVPVVLGDEAATLAARDRLLAHGIAVAAIRPPTVPAGTARLRISLSAAHDETQVDALLAALRA